jgi:hypothetical protein
MAWKVPDQEISPAGPKVFGFVVSHAAARIRCAASKGQEQDALRQGPRYDEMCNSMRQCTRFSCTRARNDQERTGNLCVCDIRDAVLGRRTLTSV